MGKRLFSVVSGVVSLLLILLLLTACEASKPTHEGYDKQAYPYNGQAMQASDFKAPSGTKAENTQVFKDDALQLGQNVTGYPELDLQPIATMGLNEYFMLCRIVWGSNTAKVGILVDTPTGANGGTVLSLDAKGNWALLDAATMGQDQQLKTYASGPLQGLTSTTWVSVARAIIPGGRNILSIQVDNRPLFANDGSIEPPFIIPFTPGGFGFMSLGPIGTSAQIDQIEVWTPK